jgi:hypothetical protein
MSYQMPWGSTHPGCLIVLLDQSGSMDDKFGGSQLGAGKKKCDMVATILNNLLHEFIKSNTVGAVIKPRVDVAVVGYNGSGVSSALPESLRKKSFVTLPELAAEPLRTEIRSKKEVDDTGNIIEIPTPFPIWVEPVASGGTPMLAAFYRARELAQQWAQTHLDNYPPVIINVTDGMATDVKDTANPVELIQAASDLKQVRTNDGEALLFNCHITDKSDPEVAFPVNEAFIPNDPFARMLFSISSVIPDSALQNILNATGTALPPGARGFIFNGDAGSIRQMFLFASIQAFDPNR